MTNENSTLVHEGVTYRKVNRKAEIGEKVLSRTQELNGSISSDTVYEITCIDTNDGGYGACFIDNAGEERAFWTTERYLVLEPVEQPLTLTEADVRNNPRQVIDLLGNLALRLTKAENAIERLDKRIDDEEFLSDEWADEIDDRIDRLASANEQAINSVARNVETWAQEFENFKHSPAPWATQAEVIDLAKKVADINERTQPYQQAHELFVKIAEGVRRNLTAEERREL